MKRKLVAASFCVALFTGLTSAYGATMAAGDVLSFGDNFYGQTGLGMTFGITPLATAIDTSNLGDRAIKQADAGAVHSLLLAEDGSVFSFGFNSSGQTGLVTASGFFTTVATLIDTSNLGGRGIKQVAAGYEHSLLLAEDGTVFSFGANYSGQTGLGTTSGFAPVATPIDTSNLSGRAITQISAGGNHSLLLAEDGTVFSFGVNSDGQTGLGTTFGIAPVATPIDTSNLGGRAITQISAGGNHSLLLADDGTIFSFGANYFDQAGLGSAIGFTNLATPIDASNLGGRMIKQVAAGESHSLLLADDGSVFSFGSNYFGATGLGTISGSTTVATPIDASNLSGTTITQVAAGNSFSLLLAEDGTVFSFGFNNNGRTGLGTTDGFTPVATPIDTSNLGGLAITHVAAGDAHSLLIAALIGDLDGDGFVGVTDLNLVLSNWNQNVTPGDPLVGDPSGDGFVGIEDLNQVLGNWNAAAPPSLTAVPEPGTLALAGPALLGLAVRRRKRD